MIGDLNETIVAIATAPGGAVRGVVRVSGIDALACVRRCFEPASELEWDTLHRAQNVSGSLQLPPPLGDLTAEMYVWPTQRSYTRQPTVELHLCGARPVLDATVRLLCMAGARLARQGEFTLRAFLAGRIDLTQAEAVLGVIDADNGAALQVALTQLAGGLRQPLDALRDQLLDLLAHLEAGLDFVEEDIAFVTDEQLLEGLATARQSADQLLHQIGRRQYADDIPRVVLRGWPNVGKSSLFNALAGRNAALVSRRAGTTRDYVTCHVPGHAGPFLLVDTAGTVDGRAGVDGDAQRAAVSQYEQASVELVCLDRSRPFQAGESERLLTPTTGARVIVWTKADLASKDRNAPQLSGNGPATNGPATNGPKSNSAEFPCADRWPEVLTSSVTRQGMESLKAVIDEQLTAHQPVGDVVPSTGERCRANLTGALDALDRAHDLVEQQGGEELVAAEIRHAIDGLGEVAGRIYTDDILDRVFSRFCIGK